MLKYMSYIVFSKLLYYILYGKDNLPIAIVEAKDNDTSVRSGLMQGVGYGEILDIPFIYSSNGDGFFEYDRTKTKGNIEKEIKLHLIKLRS